MDRRGFVQFLAGLPFIFGFEGTNRSQVWGRSDALRQGLQQMSSLERPGIVLVVPTEPTERAAWGRLLYRWTRPTVREFGRRASRRHGRPARATPACQRYALSSTCILICLEEKDAVAAFESKATIMVIDLQRRVLRQLDSLPPGSLTGFATQLTTQVQGQDLQHLRSRTAAFQEGLVATRRQTLTRFIGDMANRVPPSLYQHEYDDSYQAKRDQVISWLAKTPALSQWLALALLESRSNQATELELLLGSLRPRLPVGSVLPRFKITSCNGFREVKPGITRFDHASRFACGMSLPSPTGGRYLRFVGDK